MKILSTQVHQGNEANESHAIQDGGQPTLLGGLCSRAGPFGRSVSSLLAAVRPSGDSEGKYCSGGDRCRRAGRRIGRLFPLERTDGGGALCLSPRR